MSDNPFAQLGLGENFTPTPVGWRMGGMETPNGKLTVIAFHTISGIFGITLEEENGLDLSNQIRESFGGIIVAQPTSSLTLP